MPNAEPNPEPVDLGSFGGSQLVAGQVHTCLVLSSEEVVCWGDNTAGQLGDGTEISRHTPALVRDLFGAVALSAGIGHTCAIRRDGVVVCWGLNDQGQLGDGTTENRLEPVRVLAPVE